MTDIATLVMKVDSSDVKTGTAELTKLEQSATSAEQAGYALGRVIGVAGIAITAAAGAMALMTKHAIDAADAMNDLHLKTGLAFKDIAMYDQMARQSGTTTEGVAQSFKFLGRYMTDHGDRLRELGVTSKDSSTAMGQFADIISSIQDPALRSTLAMTVLGRSGAEMLPMLMGGSAAFKAAAKDTSEYGAALERIAPQADAFNDKLAQIATQAKLGGLRLAENLLPALNEVAAGFLKVQKESGTFLATLYAVGNITLKAVGYETDPHKRAVIEMNEALAKHSELIAEINRRKALGADVGALRAELAETDKLLKAKIAIVQANKEADAGGASGKGAIENADAKAKELLNAVQRKRLQEEENKRIDAQAAEEIKMREADAAANQRAVEHEFTTGKQRLDNIDKQIIAQKRHNEEIGKTPEQLAKIKAKYDEMTISTLEAEAAQLRYYGSDISDAGAMRLQQLEEEIKKRRELVRIEEAATPLEAAKKTAAEMEAANKKAAAEAEQHWKNFSRNVQSHLGDSLYNALNGTFKNIGDSFKQMIFRMMADAAAADLTKAILGSPSSGGGGGMGFIQSIGSKIGGMLSFAGGGSTGSGARSGGVDGMGGFPAILHPNETIIDHAAGQTGGGNSVTVVQNINIDSRSDYATVVGAMMRAKDMAKAEIMQSLQRGGDFAGAVGRA